jgi:hypothetical protein
MYIGNMQKAELSAFIEAEIASGINKHFKKAGIIIPNDDSTAYYTINQVASLFKKKRATIHNWIKKGLLKKYKVGTNTFFKKSEVDTLLN